MRTECSTKILVCLVLVYISVKTTKGKSLGHGKDVTNVNRDAIEDIRTDLRRVLHFINELSEDKYNQAPDKSRSQIPLHYLLWTQAGRQADVSVVKETAIKAAKAVQESLATTLKTQKGVKIISKGLQKLGKCLKKFEQTIKV